MIRMLAWCGMKASRSSAATPAFSSACWATGAICQTAHRNTGWPFIVRAGHFVVSGSSRSLIQLSRDRIASHCSPSEPQTVGPMPGTSDGPITTAPAPSPKMNAVPRSSRSVKSDSFSTPTTSTYSALPPVTMSPASATPWQKPAQAAEMSKAAAGVAPSWWVRIEAADGVCYGCVTVATITAPIREASSPAASSACRDAVSAMSTTVSSGAAKRRETIPDRSRIHSSEELIRSTSSSLVTTRSGRYPPTPRMRAYRAPLGGLMAARLEPSAVVMRGPRRVVSAAGDVVGCSCGYLLGVQADDRLARRHRVAVLDEPLDDPAPVRGDHVVGVPQRGDGGDGVAAADVLTGVQGRHPHGALRRCDDQPPGGVLRQPARLPVPGHHVARRLEVGRSLQGQRLDAGQGPLDQAGEGARRGDLDHAGD